LLTPKISRTSLPLLLLASSVLHPQIFENPKPYLPLLLLASSVLHSQNFENTTVEWLKVFESLLHFNNVASFSYVLSILSLFIHLFDLILEKESYCCVSLFSIPIIHVSLLFYLDLSLFIHLFDLVLEKESPAFWSTLHFDRELVPNTDCIPGLFSALSQLKFGRTTCFIILEYKRFFYTVKCILHPRLLIIKIEWSAIYRCGVYCEVCSFYGCLLL